MATGEHDEPGPGQAPDHAACDLLVGAVAPARNDRDRHLESRERIPQRLHHPLSKAAQRGGEVRWTVAPVVSTGEPAGILGLAREQRLRAPALDEVLQAACLQLGGERIVGGPAPCALVLIRDTGRAGDEHETGDPPRRREGNMQADSPPQRVAAQHEALGSARQHMRDAAGERDRALARHTPMPGQIESQRQVALGMQAGRHAVPGMARAAEAVQQDDRLRHIAIVVS